MAEGTTGSYNPETGERRTTTFQYEPVAPRAAEVAGMGAIDQTAIAENIKNFGVEQAMKGIEAAVQFQGMRGYQQALKNGESAEKAMVRFGPMMFARQASAFAPSMKVLTPKAVPQITPNQQQQNEFSRQRIAATELARQDKLAAAKLKPRPEDYENITEPGTKAVVGIPGSPAEVKSFLWIDALARDKAAIPDIPGKPGTPIKRYKVLRNQPAALPVGTTTAPRPLAPPFYSSDEASMPIGTSPAQPERSRMTKVKFDALKSGEEYVGNDGKRYRKP